MTTFWNPFATATSSQTLSQNSLSYTFSGRQRLISHSILTSPQPTFFSSPSPSSFLIEIGSSLSEETVSISLHNLDFFDSGRPKWRGGSGGASSISFLRGEGEEGPYLVWKVFEKSGHEPGSEDGRSRLVLESSRSGISSSSTKDKSIFTLALVSCSS